MSTTLTSSQVKDLTERAMLARVSITRWGGTTLDKEATAKVHHDAHASDEAGRYTKRLVDRKAMNAVKTAAEHIRRAFKHHTLPWDDDGWKLLPMTAYPIMDAETAKSEDAFNEAAEEFCQNYEALKTEAKATLGKLYNEADYPDVSEIRSKFSCKIEFRTIPTSDDIRVKVSKDIKDRLVADVNRQVELKLREAIREPWDRIVKTIGDFTEAMQNYNPDGIAKDKDGNHILNPDGTPKGKIENPFRDSKLEHVRDLAAILPHLNIMADADLQRIAYRIQQELASLDIETLRNDPVVRSNAAASAAEITDIANIYLNNGGAALN